MQNSIGRSAPPRSTLLAVFALLRCTKTRKGRRSICSLLACDCAGVIPQICGIRRLLPARM